MNFRYIKVDVRTVPEIAEAYKNRDNKKDSFDRWFDKGNGILFDWYINGKRMVAVHEH